MSKSLNLIQKHCPNLFKIIVENGSSNLEELDERMLRQLEEKGKNKTSLISMLIRVEGGDDPFLTSFTSYMDDLIGEMLHRIPEHTAGIWESLRGKFSNIVGWNFLNPIGELSALKHLLSTEKNALLAMESPYPNGRSKDFLLKSNSDDGELLVEVVNIHSPIEPVEWEELKIILLEKLEAKIKRETTGVTDPLLLDKLIIMPVVWYLEVETLREHHDFFSSFSTTMGESAGLKTKSFGFHTYVKTTDNKILFADAATILETNL